MATVQFEKVCKRYGETSVVCDFDLQITDGELVVLVGGSGCGKSTTLRMLAGLETVTSGSLRIAEREITHLLPRERDVAMVFQDYALYPHLSARENIALGLRLRKVPKDEIEKRVREASAILGIDPVLDRKPKQMSGGQRQRVAMGRAMVREPAVFLFDEPLSNLDAKLRGQMRIELARLQRRLGVTTLYVTHDQVEAMTLGDRLVVLEGGRIQQVGPPIEIYRAPKSRFVAGFIGSPPMNFLDGELVAANGELAWATEGLRVPLPLERRPRTMASGRITLGVRAEDLTFASEVQGRPILTGQLVLAECLGSVTQLHVDSGPHRLVALVSTEADLKIGTSVSLAVDPSRVHLFAADGVSLL